MFFSLAWSPKVSITRELTSRLISNTVLGFSSQRSPLLRDVGLSDPRIAVAKKRCIHRFILVGCIAPVSKFGCLQKPVSHLGNPAEANVIVSYPLLEWREPC